MGRRFVVMGGPAGTAYGAASGARRAYGYARGSDGSGADGANGASREYDLEGTAEEIDPDDPQLPR